MNREIKFRLHDQEGNIIGYEIHEKNEYGCWQIYHTSLRGDWKDNNVNRLVIDGYFIAAKTKCEYTGLKDKNDKEIYEGDILKFRSHPEKIKIGNVYYEPNWARFLIKSQDEFEKSKSTFSVKSFGALNHKEVIGNIYENKDLLK